MTADCVRVKRIRLRMLAAGLAGLAFPACALEPKLAPLGLPSASMFSATLLPEREGVIPWKTFADVDPVKAGSKFTAQFGRAVLALDRRRRPLPSGRSRHCEGTGAGDRSQLPDLRLWQARGA